MYVCREKLAYDTLIGMCKLVNHVPGLIMLEPNLMGENEKEAQDVFIL